jgi:hypothetical protein
MMMLTDLGTSRQYEGGAGLQLRLFRADKEMPIKTQFRINLTFRILFSTNVYEEQAGR